MSDDTLINLKQRLIATKARYVKLGLAIDKTERIIAEMEAMECG